MKNFEIITDYYGDGWKLRVRVLNDAGLKELEELGYFFDDFFGDGTEIWKR